eukprot:scaffold97873_cov54-Phaeocystis_antarctica.AAC.1
MRFAAATARASGPRAASCSASWSPFRAMRDVSISRPASSVSLPSRPASASLVAPVKTEPNTAAPLAGDWASAPAASRTPPHIAQQRCSSAFRKVQLEHGHCSPDVGEGVKVEW